MAPKFEQPRRAREAPKERRRLHEARWADRADVPTADTDVAEADVPMAEIYRDKRQFEAYKKVGFHLKKESFLEMIERWEKDEKLTDTDRNMREEVRLEFVTRMGIVKSCEKLLTKDIFKGLRDADDRINRLVGELGEDWVLDLIKPRLINLVGEPDGTASLTDLWQSLRNFHGAYETRGFQKVYSRIEQYREKYGITPQKWAEIQRGGSLTETAGRAYKEFQKQHGILGRLWHAVPESWHAVKIGLAGRSEEQNSQGQRMRETRSHALEILGRIIGPDFQDVVDRAIKTGDKEKTESVLQKQEGGRSELARGLTERQLQSRHDKAWEQYVADNVKKNSANGYEKWLEETFQPDYKREANEETGGGWVAQLMMALFGIRMKNLKRPNFPARTARGAGGSAGGTT